MTRALREYLADVGNALRMSSDATKLNLDDPARRDTAVAVARLDRDDAFMERLIGGLWEKYPDKAREAEWPQVGEKHRGRTRKKPRKKRRSLQQCGDDDTFYDGWKKSPMTLPQYSRAKGKTPKEGDRIRARVTAERTRTNVKSK